MNHHVSTRADHAGDRRAGAERVWRAAAGSDLKRRAIQQSAYSRSSAQCDALGDDRADHGRNQQRHARAKRDCRADCDSDHNRRADRERDSDGERDGDHDRCANCNRCQRDSDS